MACGTPVVASNTTGLAEAVGDAGLTVDPTQRRGRSPRRCGACSTTRPCASGSWPPGTPARREFTWARAAQRHGRGLPRGARMSVVVAVVVSHGQRDLLRGCLEALARDGVPGARVRERARRQRRAGALARLPRLRQRAAAHVRAERERADRGDDRALRPDPQPRRAARARVRRAPRRARRGARALRRRGPAPARDATARTQRSRRRFPTVGGTLVRRTPLRALLRDVEAAQPGHYLADVPDAPVECDWMLGACLLLRRSMLDELGGFDEGFPMYGEDIELQYRAQLGRLGALVRARTRSRRTTTSASSTARSSRAAPGGTCAAWRATCAATRRRCCAADAALRMISRRCT